MFRTRILGAMLAAGALVLSACGSSSDGTPSAAESPTSSASEPTAADGDGAGDTADDESDVAGDTADDESDVADDTDASDAESGDDDTDVTPAALDDQSAAWFTTFCGIAEPFDNFFGALMGAAMAGSGGGDATPEDLATVRDSLVTAFGDLGGSMTDVSGELSGMAPPTIDGGAEQAEKVVSGLAVGGPALQGMADKFGAIDTSSPEAFSAAMDQLMGSIDEMSESMGIDDFDLDDATKAAVEELPACSGSMLFASMG